MKPSINYDVILPAMRVGFARAISESGLTPSQAERKLADGGGVGSLFSTIVDLGKKYSLGLIAGGALIGGVSGIARSKLEQRLEDQDDPEIAAVRTRADGYKQMSRELRDEQAATAPVYQPGRPQEAMR